ncbi:MAG: hypothetical protein M3539_04500 [Acidobacteriota bacterium]|nr:hypothetical protein [Acidobacteriota bacterium]
MKKILIVAPILLVIAFATFELWSPRKQNRAASTPAPIADPRPPTAAPTIAHNHEAMSRVPAHFKDAPSLNTLRGTLAPELFVGNVQLAYRAAQEIPQTLAQLPCYCHCDMSKGHKSLHSCFEDEHGENCGICIGEAVMAYNLERQGLKPTQIREQIIRAYGSARSD